ncbi:hypothetical protein LSG31_00590 [Fodinisporobacter ferrooxydans]|uniref:Uncharacterized protein n=1 Tax=Fodinisporobacter ferrooxydans TaxID=2901836 RepID=A0ABY4CNK0_9BACL|nr:hypothetical protein LSG31_00590 [Alicyclobacillaceae bacterium MYW30-H2]
MALLPWSGTKCYQCNKMLTNDDFVVFTDNGYVCVTCDYIVKLEKQLEQAQAEIKRLSEALLGILKIWDKADSYRDFYKIARQALIVDGE